jgi:hypothetical protein
MPQGKSGSRRTEWHSLREEVDPWVTYRNVEVGWPQTRVVLPEQLEDEEEESDE